MLSFGAFRACPHARTFDIPIAMNILYITLEPPFDAQLIARGNTIRVARIQQGLTAAGHQVAQVWRAPYDDSEVAEHAHMYRDAGELAVLIDQHQPDAILVGYWALLEDLPSSLEAPVVVDFIAPRPLEALFEDTATRDTEMRRLLKALARADGYIVANQRQEHLLIPYLLMAGHDLRQQVPIVQLPITAAQPLPAAPQPPADRWLIVGGGVDWPWRRQQQWLGAIADYAAAHNPDAANSVHLIQFGGDYPRIVQQPDGQLNLPELTEPVYQLQLSAYSDYARFLSDQAHIGVELAERNVERYFSQSFRAMDYLRHGLPVICNAYLAQAESIAEYDAGWLVEEPQQLPQLLDTIIGDRELWQRKSANARRLATEKFNIDQYIPALLDLFAQCRQSTTADSSGGAFSLLGVADGGDDQEVMSEKYAQLQDEVQQLQSRNQQLALQVQEMQRPTLKGMIREVARRVLRRLPKPGADGTPGNVVIVTRSDLFPTDHGGAVKIVETARGLSLNQREVGIVSDRRDIWWHYHNGEMQQRRFPLHYRLFSLPRSLSTLFHLSTDVPESNAFLYLPLSDDSFIWRTAYVARKIKANVYQAEFPAYARPCILTRSLRGGKVIVVEHNVEYNRLREQEASLTSDQYQRLKEIEIGLCNQSDAVICVSENDRTVLRRDGVAGDKLHYVPHGVDLSTFDAARPRDLRSELGWSKDTAILVYHGTYEYPPNLEAIKVMAREVLPRLNARGREVRVLAVGKMPPSNPVHEHVHFTGSIPVVAEALKAADIAVVPLLKGGGTRMKIIDYFACGIPVVSTRKGIEGIPVRHGHEAFIEDDWERLCDHIETLLDQPQRYQQMVAAARAFVEPLDWRELAKRYGEVYNQAG
ncbi:MAG: hypothetical protein Tsb002_03060 [Wenzhouxiangellaceae bacterium]